LEPSGNTSGQHDANWGMQTAESKASNTDALPTQVLI